jgi:hypothetical protein
LTIGRFGLCDRCGADVTGKLVAYDLAERTVRCERCAVETGIASDARESRTARTLRRERLIRENT